MKMISLKSAFALSALFALGACGGGGDNGGVMSVSSALDMRVSLTRDGRPCVSSDGSTGCFSGGASIARALFAGKWASELIRSRDDSCAIK